MTAPSAEPVSIVGEDLRVSGLLLAPADARACYVLAHGAGAGMAHPFMQAIAAGFARAQHRDVALSVPLHGGGAQAPRSAGHRARDRARGGRARRSAVARLAAGRRRQVVRRTHDLAGAGRRSPARRARARVPRISAASGRASRRRTRAKHLADVTCPDAVPAGNARRARRARSARAGVQGARGARDPAGCSTMPTIPSTCRRAPAARMPRCAPSCSMLAAEWISAIGRH